jgi:hypothetical protein
MQKEQSYIDYITELEKEKAIIQKYIQNQISIHEERLGKSLFEIVELLQEINSQILINTGLSFVLEIDNKPYTYYLYSDKLFFEKCDIKFIKFNITIEIYNINPIEINKSDILKWMTYLVLNQ